MQKIYSILAFIAICGIGCTPKEEVQQASNEFGFVTMLGNDTLAMENVTVTDSKITADVLLRSPEVRMGKYELLLDQEKFVGLTAQILRGGAILYVDNYRTEGDSIVWQRTQSENNRSGKMAYSADLLPFIDMVHWPFEVMIGRLRTDTTSFPVFSGARGFDFELWNTGGNELVIRHPSRGEMMVEKTKAGQLAQLDAGKTTRKLLVTRTAPLDLIKWESEYSEQEKQGKVFGALSGRGSGEFVVEGATISFDYGQPKTRGREIWGALVPYGKRWRTGANRATHMKTDKTIQLGTLEIPPGEYTLFSIPEKENLTLIVNSQTGQNGQTYNEERDFGRTEMSFRVLDEPQEDFTIAVEGGMLRLQWGDGEYRVELSVK